MHIHKVAYRGRQNVMIEYGKFTLLFVAFVLFWNLVVQVSNVLVFSDPALDFAKLYALSIFTGGFAFAFARILRTELRAVWFWSAMLVYSLCVTSLFTYMLQSQESPHVVAFFVGACHLAGILIAGINRTNDE